MGKLKTLNILEALEGKVKNCHRCRLHLMRTQTVFSDGNPLADLIALGEGPGEVEDRTGTPFTGPAGKLLDRMLETIGRDRTNTYICNVVKCRAQGPRYDAGGNVKFNGRLMNRTPEPDEVDACRPILDLQLKTLSKKRLVLCFGSTAAHWMLGYSPATLRMDGMRGRVYHSPHFYKSAFLMDGVPTVVTYHPSYLLQNPELKVKAYVDMKLAAAFLRGEVVGLAEPGLAAHHTPKYAQKADVRQWGKPLSSQHDPYTENFSPWL